MSYLQNVCLTNLAKYLSFSIKPAIFSEQFDISLSFFLYYKKRPNIKYNINVVELIITFFFFYKKS